MSLSMKLTDGRMVMEVEAQTIHLKAEALTLAATIQKLAEHLSDKLPRVRTKAKPLSPQKRAARPARKQVASSSDGAETEASAPA